MANRDLDFSPQVTDVVPKTEDTATPFDAAGDIADTIAQQSAQSKALTATAQTSLAFRQLDTQFREQYADDPTNPQGLQNLQAARQAVITKQGGSVPNIAMRDYITQSIELGKTSDTSNQLWTTRQQVHNTANNLNTGMQTYYQQANNAGVDFGTNGGDLGSALNYIDAAAHLHQNADPIIGADRSGEMMKEFNTNYVKSFVAGVAENDPQRAVALLDEPEIAQHFTTQDRNDMTQLIQKTVKTQALMKTIGTTDENGKLPDIINDQNTNYFQKRAAIDQMDMQGTITPKAAAAARRVLTSSANLDTQTDTPTMATIINQTYDLNANSKASPQDYLTGVQNIQQQILEKQGTGELTAQDASKLSKQISTLTSAKLSDATNNVGNTFYSANQRFNTLPPEYRGDATRRLFYASFGQNMSDQQLNNKADGIIDKINGERRADALATVARISNDSTFVKSLGYTDDEVQQAAKNKGITPQAVISALRAKYAKKAPARAPAANSVAPADEDEGDDKAPMPPPSPGIMLPSDEGSDDNEER